MSLRRILNLLRIGLEPAGKSGDETPIAHKAGETSGQNQHETCPLIDCPALHKKSRYYPTRFGDRVPKTVRMLQTVRSDELLRSVRENHDLVARAGCFYKAWTNSYGAVAAVLDNGEKLGLKPDEFEVARWHGDA